MPTNAKEGIIFTTLMCSMMVFVMSAYNLLLVGKLGLVTLLLGFIPGFIVAFILDVLVVGKIAMAIADKLPLNHDKMWQMILAISGMMICGMVAFMSLYGLLIEGGMPAHFWPAYLSTVGHNIIVAVPLQLIIVGPISRKILSMIHAKDEAKRVTQ